MSSSPALHLTTKGETRGCRRGSVDGSGSVLPRDENCAGAVAKVKAIVWGCRPLRLTELRYLSGLFRKAVDLPGQA